MAKDRDRLGYHESVIQDDEYFIPNTGEYSKKQKFFNWLHYCKWYLLGGIAGAVLIISVILTMLGVGRVDPDYQFAYVGGTLLSPAFLDTMAQELEAYGQDLNGDGRVKVSVVQYTQSRDISADQDYASHMQIIADVSANQTSFFLLEDPEYFHSRYPILADETGTFPEEGDTDWQSRTVCWADCPKLSSLELPDQELWGIDASIPGQELLSKVYIGVRGYRYPGDDADRPSYLDLWDTLTE